jgi:hypothetical protein
MSRKSDENYFVSGNPKVLYGFTSPTASDLQREQVAFSLPPEIPSQETASVKSLTTPTPIWAQSLPLHLPRLPATPLQARIRPNEQRSLLESAPACAWHRLHRAAGQSSRVSAAASKRRAIPPTNSEMKK